MKQTFKRWSKVLDKFVDVLGKETDMKTCLVCKEIKNQNSKPWVYSHWQAVDDFTPVVFNKDTVYFGYYQGVTFFEKYRKKIKRKLK